MQKQQGLFRHVFRNSHIHYQQQLNRTFVLKSAYKDEGTKKVLEDIRKLEHRIEAKKKMERQPYFDSLEEKDIEAIYKDLSALPSIKQPKIKDDYLKNLRIKFLDTRPLKQLSNEQQLQAFPLPDSSYTAAATTMDDNETITVDQENNNNNNNNELSDETKTALLKDVTPGDFEQLIYANALAKRPEQAEQALQLMKDNNHTPTLRCYNHLMDAYANTNNVNQVVNVFKRINQEGLTPDVYSYSSMIKALTMDTRLEDAFIVFKQMKKLNLIPTQPIFANLISGCLKSQQIDKAWETFDEMRISYHQPDEVTFTLMLHACAKKGEVERALNLFEDMVNQQLYPTDVTFNVLIHACAKRPDYYNEAFSLFDQMKNTYGFQPDLITYNTLIGVCAWKKDLSRARNLFRYIVNDDSMVPDIHSYTNMFWCYANYNPPSSSSTTTTTKENDIKESTSLTSTNIESILPLTLPNRRSEIVNEAKHLFNYMIQQQQVTVDDHNNSNITVEKNTSPIITTQLLTTYLNIHVMQRQYRECINIYDDLFSKYNVTPNAHTFMVMLRYCYQTKDSILAWRIWDEYQSFLESRTLHDSENMNDMSIMQQKQLLLKHEQQQYREGWTKQQQRKMIIMMANTLAKSNELNYSIQLLNSISKDKDFKPLKLKEVKMIYDRAILLEDEDSKEVITRLCSHNSKNFKPGSFKYTRINVK